MRLEVFSSESSWIEAALMLLATSLKDWTSSLAAAGLSRGESPGFRLCLAGGTTPRPIYEAMAASGVGEAQLELFPGDERALPFAAPGRNGHMIAEVFSRPAWSRKPLLRLWPEGPAAECAASYEALIRSLGARGLSEAAGGGRPRGGAGGQEVFRPFFDLSLLGLGEDGHTASLFPGDPIVKEMRRLAAASLAPQEPRERMSLTIPVLASTRRLVFLARGRAKKDLVARLSRGGENLPAGMLASVVERNLSAGMLVNRVDIMAPGTEAGNTGESGQSLPAWLAEPWPLILYCET